MSVIMQLCQITDIKMPCSEKGRAALSSDATTRIRSKLKTNWRTSLLTGLLINISLASLPSYSASAQINPELKEIDPAQAHYDGSMDQAPATLTAPDRRERANPSPDHFPSESMIPEFGQALPQVPASSGDGGGSFLTSGPAVSTNQANQFSVSKRLSVLEQTTFGATYDEHDPDSRLEHLERELLGDSGHGNQDARLIHLENTVLGKSGFGACVSDKPSSVQSKGEAPIGASRQIVHGQTNTGGDGGGAQNLPSLNTASNPSSHPGTCLSSSASSVVEAIPFYSNAGDYLSAIQSFNGGQLAHWTKFPIHIHLPPESPENWQNNLARGVEKWNQYIPLKTSSSNESADIEIVWVNHLVPKLLGITRLVIVSGRMHVEIFMLRPSFYPPQVAEKTLELAILHELGHALGLYAHSDNSSDIMYPVETNDDSGVRTHHWAISQRDINTLKKVYQSPNLSPNYTAQRPVEWGLAIAAEQYGTSDWDKR